MIAICLFSGGVVEIVDFLAQTVKVGFGRDDVRGRVDDAGEERGNGADNMFLEGRATRRG